MPLPGEKQGLQRVTLLLWYGQTLFPLALIVHRLVQALAYPERMSVFRLDVLLAVAWVSAAVALPATRAGAALVQRAGRQLGLMCLSCFVALLLVEVGLRLFSYGSLFPTIGGALQELREPHPTRGWALVPDGKARRVTRDFSVTARTNAKGLRDVDHEYVPDEDTFRIVVLGDSFMEAYQVELEAALPRLLESRLAGRDVEVVNLGVGGYGTTQEYVYLLEEGFRYEPDLVLLSFFAFNDVRNNHRGLESYMRDATAVTMRSFARPYGRINHKTNELTIVPPDWDRIQLWVAVRETTKVRYIDDVLVSARLVVKALAQMRSGEERAPPHDPNIWLGALVTSYDGESGGRGIHDELYARMWREAWAATFRLMLALRGECAERGAAFAMFLVPHMIEVDDGELADLSRRFPWMEFDREIAAARTLGYASRAGLHALDLAPGFRNRIKAGEGPFYHRLEDNHWNPAGHALATELLVEFLDQNGLIPPAR